MEGVRDNPELMGVIPRTFQYVFENTQRTDETDYLVRAR